MTQTTQAEHLTRLSMAVPADLKRDLEQLAHTRERSLSAEIRLALRRHVLASQTLAAAGGDHPDGGVRRS